MMDFATARRHMVEGQLRTNEINGPALIGAMLALPRERFVPDAWRPLAYTDRSLPLDAPPAGAEPRQLMAPMVFGKLVTAAEVGPADRVLHVGAGTGYGSAVLSRVAASVVALEEDPALVRTARALLAELGVANVQVVAGPLASGRAEDGPFDVILIEGAIEELPEAFAAQLAPEGRLVAVVGQGRAGRGTVFRKAGQALSGFPAFGASAPVLPGFSRPKAFVF